MKKVYTFRDLQTYVDACEYFADQLVRFCADPVELTITAHSEIPESMKNWLRISAISVTLG